MQKVMIIGCPGSGKSTFARRLRDLTGLPLYYLDMLWHKPDRTNITKEEFDARLIEISFGVYEGKCFAGPEKNVPEEWFSSFFDAPENFKAAPGGESLDDVFIVQHLVQIQRVHPSGMESGEELVHDYYQVKLFVRIFLNIPVLLFVGYA